MLETRRKLLELVMTFMGELHRGFATSRDKFLRNYQLSRAQLELLFSIKKANKSTSELAKQFSVSSSAISQMVDQLENKRLVKRVHGTEDKRVTYVELSDNGKEMFKHVRAEFVDHLGERFQSISDNELQTLLAVLEKITTQMNSVRAHKERTQWKK